MFWKIAITPESLEVNNFLLWQKKSSKKGATHLLLRVNRWSTFSLKNPAKWFYILHARHYQHLSFYSSKLWGIHCNQATQEIIFEIHQKYPHLKIGFSVHSYEEILKMQSFPVNYFILGNFFPTLSHPERKPISEKEVKKILAKIRRPVILIGGITTKERIERVKKIGASGFASIRYFL